MKTETRPERMNPSLKRLLDTADAFRYSRILLTAIELGIFSELNGLDLSATELALRLRTNPRATEILLNALVSMKLLRKRENRFYNTATGRRFLVRESPEYRGAFLVHVARFWDSWDQLTGVVKSGLPAMREKASSAAAFAWAMYHSGLERAQQVASLLDLVGVKRVLDLGGGPGHYGLTIAAACSDCHVTIFDFPETLEVTREIIDSRPDLQGRIQTLAGDFMIDNIGSQYDMILASNIIHSYGEEDDRFIIGKAMGALVPGGRLVVHDFFLDESMTEPLEAAIFSVHMLVQTDAGRAYSAEEESLWMRQAGSLEPERIVISDAPTSLLVARKPSD